MSENYFIENNSNNEVYAQMNNNAIYIQTNNNSSYNSDFNDNHYFVYYHNNYYDTNIYIDYNNNNNENNKNANVKNGEQQNQDLFTKNTNYIGETCVICLECIVDLESMALTNCNGTHHSYHETCIRQWIKTSQSCPYCRTPL